MGTCRTLTYRIAGLEVSPSVVPTNWPGPVDAGTNSVDFSALRLAGMAHGTCHGTCHATPCPCHVMSCHPMGLCHLIWPGRTQRTGQGRGSEHLQQT